MENELNIFIWWCKPDSNDNPESADVFKIGPPTSGQDSDLENEDNKTTELPEEIIAGQTKSL